MAIGPDHERATAITLPWEIDRDDIDDGARVAVNATQSRYVGQAPDVVSPDSPVLPSAIWHQTVAAGKALTQRIGSVAGFLCAEMGWTPERLDAALAPAQADAAALIIHAMQSSTRNGRDFLLGDETGFGKGRVLMTVAAWCVRHHVVPVVMTKTPGLFSNLWKDAIDIGEADTLVRPFLVNEGVKIDNLVRHGTLFGAIPAKLHRQTIRDDLNLPDGFGLVMATWSQIGVKDSAKLTWLKSLFGRQRVALIGDESHVVALMSALAAQNASQLRRLAWASCDTSATSARHAANMAAYDNIYPWLSDAGSSTLEAMPSEHQTWLSEISVAQAIGNGRLVRREIDRSGVALAVVAPAAEVIAANRATSDAFAAIVSRMRDYADAIASRCEDMNETLARQAAAANKGKGTSRPLKLYATDNFFSRLGTISGQFDACLIADLAVERAVDHLLRDIQPTVILDMTMEGAMAALAQDLDDEDFALNADPDQDADEQTRDGGDVDLATRPLTVRDLLEAMLDRLANVRLGTERVTLDIGRPEHARLATIRREIADLIAAMPDLPGSPIDYIRERIEARGREEAAAGRIPAPWVVGEISGRSARLVDGRYVRRNETTNDVIARYNSGENHVVIMTSAGSTGGSMHHSAETGSQRQRSQIEAVGSRNPIERSQTKGRIARRGALSPPLYEALVSGTPYSLGRLAVENAKARRLSAAVAGDRRAGINLDEIDFLSPAADGVARDILVGHPEIAQHLGIDPAFAKANDETWHVRRMMGRSMLLPSEQLAGLMSLFNDLMHRESCHVRNLHVSEIGAGWRHESGMALLEPGMPDADPNSLFHEDTGIVRIVRSVPYRGLDEESLPPLEGVSPLAEVAPRMRQRLAAHLETVKPGWARNVRHALSVAGDRRLYPNVRRNPCVIEQERFNRAIDLISSMRIGAAFLLPDRMGEVRPGILTGITVPANPLRWREYTVDYVVPGDETVYASDLLPFLDGQARPIADNATARSRFRRAASGQREESIALLAGNLPRAILQAARAKVGRKVRYTDDAGRERNGIILTRKDASVMLAAPLLVPSIDSARAMLAAGQSLTCENAATLTPRRDGTLLIKLESKKRGSGHSRLATVLAGISGMPAASPSFTIPANDTGQALAAVMREHLLTCSAAMRGPLRAALRGTADPAPETWAQPQARPTPARPSAAPPAPAPRRVIHPPPRPGAQTPAAPAPHPAASRPIPSRVAPTHPAPAQAAASGTLRPAGSGPPRAPGNGRMIVQPPRPGQAPRPAVAPEAEQPAPPPSRQRSFGF